MIHFLPYWEDKPLNVDAAIANIRATTEKFKAHVPGQGALHRRDRLAEPWALAG